MRTVLTFDCELSRCFATLDSAAGTSGLLIVAGGNEVRSGTHRSMAKLAADMAGHGFPVFRYDRRGVGDSEGENKGFEAGDADMDAAIRAFRAAQPQLRHLVALGNCDAATALLLHPHDQITALVLTNPWVVEDGEGAASPASTRAYYASRIRDPKAWVKVLRGGVNLRKTGASLTLAASLSAPSMLAIRVAQAMREHPIPTNIFLALHDGTAASFAHQWAGASFDPVRDRVKINHVVSASHSFASTSDYAHLRSALLDMLHSM
jgi:exosortase A-associated hydrolase 1